MQDPAQQTQFSMQADTQQLFRLAIEASPSGVLMVDAAGRIVLVNAQVEALFGYERAELIGQPVEILVPMNVRSAHPDFREGFFAQPQTRPMGAGRDLFGLRKDGTEVPIEIGLNPLETPNGTFVLSSIVDITERKRANEELQASLREKETLLREVHHRVKNNLQVISSLFSLQARYLSDPSLHAVLNESQNRVHAISLVHEKLYQAGNLARIDFQEYLQSLTQHLASAWMDPNANINVSVQTQDVHLPVDLAIPCGLIINELVSNSFKHAFPNARPGRVEVEAFRGPNGELVMRVADDGVGIPKEMDVQRPGSIGLELVKTLSRQLQGRTRVETQRGTTVEITFRDTP